MMRELQKTFQAFHPAATTNTGSHNTIENDQQIDSPGNEWNACWTSCFPDDKR
jgi:hypothetical protein